MSSQAASGAMTGLRVIDLTRVLGGPYCTQILADHGADVIKVEPPAGDEVRDWGPPFHGEDAAYFIGINRNKRSIGLDLASEGGRAVLMKMLENADVLIENFKPGTLDKWGIGNDVLRAKFPRLVHCRISGFGADGPRGGNPGYDAIIQAMTGMIMATGSPQSGPMRIGVPVVDITTGLYAAIGILMALSERQRSGLRPIPRDHAVRDRPCRDAPARCELLHARQAAGPHRQRASQSRSLRDLFDPHRQHLHRRRQ
jgi:crotonobetainyl-CoA:carnitine CoA-transferase CaiB-like acyl-CoA transferase